MTAYQLISELITEDVIILLILIFWASSPAITVRIEYMTGYNNMDELELCDGVPVTCIFLHSMQYSINQSMHILALIEWSVMHSS